MPEFGSNIKEQIVNGVPTIIISRLQVVAYATGTGSAFFENEVPTGTINGVNRVFTLANAPALGQNGITSLQVFSDGIRIEPAQFTVIGTTLTFNVGSPNIPTNALLVDYRS